MPAELKDRLALAIGGRAYRAYLELLASPRMQRLMNAGARPQRLLWASTGTKDPDTSDTLYIDGLASPYTVNTMPDATLKAFADHGAAPPVLLPPDGGDAEEVLAAFAAAGVDVDAYAAELQQEGAEKFVDSWTVAAGDDRRASARPSRPGADRRWRHAPGRSTSCPSLGGRPRARAGARRPDAARALRRATPGAPTR